MTEQPQGPQPQSPQSPQFPQPQSPQSPGAQPPPQAPQHDPTPLAPGHEPPQAGSELPPPQPVAAPPQHGYGYAPADPGNTSAILALILGIVGIFVFPPTAPFAWWQGVAGKGKVDRGETNQNRGMAVAGQVLGIIGTVLLVLYALGFILLIIVGIASST